ncbi:MAG: chemotaxis response regulator protein-glutamate methylesterase [Gammaproteobacteria bacterium]|nr:chemotaxis response regulator protein-glutamate methylesterase [Gammaproteobacteria bacterium]
MTCRVLIVDDSGFYRRRLTQMLSMSSEIEIIGAAEDGQEAVTLAAELRPDVVTMDVEMPVLDGIGAVRQIMARCPTSIMMFSSLTHEGAKATLDALDAGAADFMPKNLELIATDREQAAKEIIDRVLALAKQPKLRYMATPSVAVAPVAAVASAAMASAAVMAPQVNIPPPPVRRSAVAQCKLVVIGTSTGGPVALRTILSELPEKFPVPIVMVQHMPSGFTQAFAERLDQTCNISVHEASEGDELKAGTALLAPGGRQLTVQQVNGKLVVRIRDSEEGEYYKPCVDVSLRSVAKALAGQVLVVILTGMGADGCDGAKLLKGNGASVWAQDEASCVVYGMPRAVQEAGIVDQVLSLDQVATALTQGVKSSVH